MNDGREQDVPEAPPLQSPGTSSVEKARALLKPERRSASSRGYPATRSAPCGPVENPVIEGRYRLDEPLAEGGMGVVYRGYNLALQRAIAIKILRDEFASDGEAVARFLQEARVGAAIGGQHVAQVFDIGRTQAGVPFLVTELLEGSELSKLLHAHVRLDIRQAVELLIAVCEAVADIHDADVVHRDLKPDNLFLVRQIDSTLLVKVLDFGVAKRLGSGGLCTNTECSLGSPHYMSPEQIVYPGQVDVRADIWALGVILFEFLTGQVPFNGDTIPSICSQIVREACPAPTSLRPEIPQELESIVLRCLRKSPQERFQGVRELKAHLQALVSSVPWSPSTDPEDVEATTPVTEEAEPAPKRTGNCVAPATLAFAVCALTLVALAAAAVSLWPGAEPDGSPGGTAAFAVGSDGRTHEPPLARRPVRLVETSPSGPRVTISGGADRPEIHPALTDSAATSPPPRTGAHDANGGAQRPRARRPALVEGTKTPAGGRPSGVSHDASDGGWLWQKRPPDYGNQFAQGDLIDPYPDVR